MDPAAEAAAVQVAGLILAKESAVLALALFCAGKGLQVTISKCVIAFQVQVWRAWAWAIYTIATEMVSKRHLGDTLDAVILM